MTAMTVYGALSLPRLPSTKQPTVGPGIPQHKPLGFQRKLQSFAFNPAIDVGFPAVPRPSPFVRPDVPPVADDKRNRSQDRDVEATAEASFKARPQFRSALEQVSFVTNNKLWATHEVNHEERRVQRPRLGIFGL